MSVGGFLAVVVSGITVRAGQAGGAVGDSLQAASSMQASSKVTRFIVPPGTVFASTIPYAAPAENLLAPEADLGTRIPAAA